MAGVVGGLTGMAVGAWGGSFFGPYGLLIGAATGMVSGYKSTIETKEDLAKGTKTLVTQEGNKLGVLISAESNKLNNTINEHLQKLQYAVGMIALPILGNSIASGTSPISAGLVGTVFASVAQPVLIGAGVISGLAYFRGALLNHKNVTFANSAGRALLGTVGACITYLGYQFFQVAKSGTLDTGEAVSSIARIGCGIGSSAFLLGNALTIGSVLDPYLENFNSEDNHGNKQ